jgi:hypothetical protein
MEEASRFTQILARRARQGQGKANGRFLLGSAAMDLLRQTSESLAGRIAYLELGPFDILETGPSLIDQLWMRGGFPAAIWQKMTPKVFEWRRGFIQTYLERDIPQFGSRVPAETLRRFWTMLAHNQALQPWHNNAGKRLVPARNSR